MRLAKTPRLVTGALAGLAVLSGIVPLARAFFLEEVSYNEGWNVYNAQTVANGGLLYPVRHGWTTVNYPMLSFWLMAQCHRVTHDYLFTARVVSILSLLAVAVMTALVVRASSGSRWAAGVAGLFCWTVFCATAPLYVGVDDPQMLGQAVLMLGLLVYVRGHRSVGRMAVAAFVFAAGLFVKHNQVDLPLAVFADLLFVSVPLALWFGACLVGFAGVGVLLCVRYGGPFFFAQLVAPRGYSWAKAGLQLVDVVGPLTVVFAAAAYTAWRGRRNPRRRVLSLLLVLSVALGGYFSGGRGVSANALFTVLLAISMLVALFLDEIREGGGPVWLGRLAPYAPLLCLCSLLIPLGRSGDWNPVGRFREARVAQRRFAEDVAVLRSLPGNALCESLLECYEAGKPFLYDPFNATRLIQAGELNQDDLLFELREGEIGAVQTNGALAHANSLQNERFAAGIEDAVKTYYVPVHVRAPDPALDWGPAHESVIYAPRAAER